MRRSTNAPPRHGPTGKLLKRQLPSPAFLFYLNMLEHACDASMGAAWSDLLVFTNTHRHKRPKAQVRVEQRAREGDITLPTFQKPQPPTSQSEAPFSYNTGPTRRLPVHPPGGSDGKVAQKRIR